MDFARTPAVVPSAEPISKKDLTLRTFKPGKDLDWRGPQSCWVKRTMVPLDVISVIPLQKIRHADHLIAPTPSHITTKDKRKAKTPPQLVPAPKRARGPSRRGRSMTESSIFLAEPLSKAESLAQIDQGEKAQSSKTIADAEEDVSLTSPSSRGVDKLAASDVPPLEGALKESEKKEAASNLAEGQSHRIFHTFRDFLFSFPS